MLIHKPLNNTVMHYCYEALIALWKLLSEKISCLEAELKQELKLFHTVSSIIILISPAHKPQC